MTQSYGIYLILNQNKDSGFALDIKENKSTPRVVDSSGLIEVPGEIGSARTVNSNQSWVGKYNHKLGRSLPSHGKDPVGDSGSVPGVTHPQYNERRGLHY